jgi:hypothetical protein
MSERKYTSRLVASMVAVLAVTSADAETDGMKIRIRMNGTDVTATLIDNPTSQDFASLLPLTLKLEDYGEAEKIVICRESCPRRGRRQAAIRPLDISATTLPGET